MVFPIGKPNDAFAQYFIGHSYLAPVSTSQVGVFNVHLSRAVETTGIYIMPNQVAARFLYVQPDADTIRKKAKKPLK